MDKRTVLRVELIINQEILNDSLLALRVSEKTL